MKQQLWSRLTVLFVTSTEIERDIPVLRCNFALAATGRANLFRRSWVRIPPWSEICSLSPSGLIFFQGYCITQKVSIWIVIEHLNLPHLSHYIRLLVLSGQTLPITPDLYLRTHLPLATILITYAWISLKKFKKNSTFKPLYRYIFKPIFSLPSSRTSLQTLPFKLRSWSSR